MIYLTRLKKEVPEKGGTALCHLSSRETRGY